MNHGFNNSVFDNSYIDIIDNLAGIYTDIRKVLETIKITMPQIGYRGAGLSVSLTLAKKTVVLKFCESDSEED